VVLSQADYLLNSALPPHPAAPLVFFRGGYASLAS